MPGGRGGHFADGNTIHPLCVDIVSLVHRAPSLLSGPIVNELGPSMAPSRESSTCASLTCPLFPWSSNVRLVPSAKEFGLRAGRNLWLDGGVVDLPLFVQEGLDRDRKLSMASPLISWPTVTWP